MTSKHRANYEMARQITRDWGLGVRVLMFAIFGLNAYVLWVALPWVLGPILGGAMGLFTAALVVGEAWRQFQIRALGYSDGPVADEEDQA